MTRLLLSLLLAGLALGMGIWTAVVASYNHERGANLSALERDLEILRAQGDQAEARAAAHVWGEPPRAPETDAGVAQGVDL